MSTKMSKVISRRNFLKLVIAGAGTTGLGLYGINRQGQVDYSDPAYLYWKKNSLGALNLENYLVLCASLAPSPHNTQPWKFKIKENEILVFADRDRNLGAGDKHLRMMLLSIGCAIENIRIAASHLGHDPEVVVVANNHFESTGLCARILLSKQAVSQPHALFEPIFRRQTTRAPFLNIPVPGELTQAVSGMNSFPFLSLRWFREKSEIDILGNLNSDAVRSYVADNAAYLDSLKWWRYSRDEILSKRDGISIFTAAAPTLIKQYFQWMVNKEMMAGDFGKDGEINLMNELLPATPLWGVISSDKLDFDARVNGGQLAERVYLEITRQGYRIMPISYITEQDTYSIKMKEAFNIPMDHELLFVFRVGKSDECEKSVRRSLDEIII